MSSFFGLDLADLESLKVEYLACLKAIATAGQSYTIGGRQFTRPDINSVKDLLKEVQEAIDLKKGKRVRRVYADFSRSRGNV